MPNDDTHEIAERTKCTDAPLRWLWKFNHGFDLVKGLSLVTVLSSLAVGYFQYLNAYQEKVSSQAKEDMASAAATFTEISRAFSEMQALQQTLYSDFTRAVRDKSDASERRWPPRTRRRFRSVMRKRGSRSAKISTSSRERPKSTSTGPAIPIAIRPRSVTSTTIRCRDGCCATTPSTVPTSTIFRPSESECDGRRCAAPRKLPDDKYCAIAEKRGVDDDDQAERCVHPDLRRPQRQGMPRESTGTAPSTTS